MSCKALSILTLLLVLRGAAGWAEAPSVTRLALLGDSITAGSGASAPAKRYATVLTELLRAANPTIVEINLGIGASCLNFQKPDYAERVLANNPDAVVIQWGVNDYYWGYSVAQFAIAYDRLVSALRQARPQMPLVVTTLIADFRYPENQDQWIGEANVALQEIAWKYGCYLADCHRAFNHDRALYADVIHPNDAGMKVMAETIYQALQGPPCDPAGPTRVTFDRGTEVRFLANVFYPTLPDAAPHWTEVVDISRTGMTVTTEVPLTVRTAPGVAAGDRVVEIRNEAGELVETVKTTLTWATYVTFRLDPQGRRQTFTVTIR